jgi:CHAT domain-containing protein
VAVAAPDFESAVAPGASGSSPARRIDKVLLPPVPWSASTGTGQAVAGEGPLRTFAKSVSLTALPAAETEARTAARIAAAADWQADLLLGEKASEPAVDALQNPGILHIGTHGIDLPGEIQQAGITMQVDPLSSQFLALTGSARTLRSWQEGTAPPSENDGILTGTEVAMINLRSTLLVTAAACHTASGTANRSEGLFGLSRAFLQAGAKNVLSALWDIDDETTAKFMEAFYTELLRQKDPDPGAVFPAICAEWLTKIAKTKGTAAAVRTIGAFTLTGRK